MNGSDTSGNGSAGSPWQSLQKAADYLRTTATWPVGQDVAVNIRPTAAYKAPSTAQATLWTDFSSAARAPAANRYLIWRADPAYSGRARIINPDGSSGNKIGVIIGASALNSHQIFSALELDGERVGKGSGAGGSLGFYLSGTAANSNTRIEILDTKIHGFRISTVVWNHTAQGLFAEGGASFLLIDQCEVYDNGGVEAFGEFDQHGLYIQAPDVQITNSSFHDQVSGFGIQFYDGGAASSPRAVVANTTLHNNYASGILIHGNEDDVRFKNLIFTDHTDRGSSSRGIEFYPAPTGAASGSVLDHVVYWNNYTNRSHAPAGWTISNERTANPLYANADVGDLHLLAGSAALGYTDTVFSPAVDHDGVPRLPGAEDGGAYER